MQSRMMNMFTIMVAAMALVAAPACAQEEIPAVIPENSIAGTAIGVEELSTLVEAILVVSEGTEEGQLNLLEALSNPEDELTVRLAVDSDAVLLSLGDCTVTYTRGHRFDSHAHILSL